MHFISIGALSSYLYNTVRCCKLKLVTAQLILYVYRRARGQFFNWHEVCRDPTREILVSEGEKAAVRAKSRFPDYTSTTSLCGALSAHKTDWSPLKDRNVVIWPDNDEPGNFYAKSVAAHAIASGAKRVRIAELPKGLPIGWDLGDDLPEGVRDSNHP